MTREYDAIILGGGIAGLAAARTLVDQGRRLLLLEARHRLGGRIHTLHPPEQTLPVELGAEFIHGTADSTFELAAAATALIDRLPDSHLWKRGSRFETTGSFWDRVEKLFKKIPTRGSDRSLRDALDHLPVDRETRRLLFSFVEGFHAADVERISAHSMAESGEGSNEQYRIVSGQDALIRSLQSSISGRCDVRSGRRVERVAWKRGSVEVTAASLSSIETFSARVAVITLPIGVLRAAAGDEGAVEFSPPLRQKSAVLEKLSMGHVARIVFQFREKFWTSGVLRKLMRAPSALPPELVYLHDADAVVPTWWSSAPAQIPRLTSWAGGPKAERLLMLDERSRVSAALASLARTLSLPASEVESLVDRWWTHDWRADPFSRGAYSYALVGGANAPAAMARPIGDTLFFGGEATSSDQSGTVAGALESGKRAGREALKVLATVKSASRKA